MLVWGRGYCLGDVLGPIYQSEFIFIDVTGPGKILFCLGMLLKLIILYSEYCCYLLFNMTCY